MHWQYNGDGTAQSRSRSFVSVSLFLVAAFFLKNKTVVCLDFLALDYPFFFFGFVCVFLVDRHDVPKSSTRESLVESENVVLSCVVYVLRNRLFFSHPIQYFYFP